MIKNILDTDIGTDIDDALALLYNLKSSKLELKGITTVYWDTKTRKRLVDKILETTPGKNIGVHAGESTPIRSSYPVTLFFGFEGEGILDKSEMNKTPDGKGGDGVDYLVNEINSHPGEYSLVTIGALTNLARAIKKDPSVQDKIKHHYAMAGRLYALGDEKRTLCYPEHNIACDVDAARIVLDSRTPKTFIPANITQKALLKREDLERLKSGDNLEKTISKLVDVWFTHADKMSQSKTQYIQAHDPLTLVIATNPEIAKIEKVRISIDEDGVTFINPSGRLINAVREVDYKKFESIYLNTVFNHRQ